MLQVDGQHLADKPFRTVKGYEDEDEAQARAA